MKLMGLDLFSFFIRIWTLDYGMKVEFPLAASLLICMTCNTNDINMTTFNGVTQYQVKNYSTFLEYCDKIFLFSTGLVGDQQSALMGHYTRRGNYDNRPYYTKFYKNQDYYFFHKPEGELYM